MPVLPRMRSGPKQKLKHGRRNTISLPLGGKCGAEQNSVIVPGFASAANQVAGFDRSVWGKTRLAGAKRPGTHAGIRPGEERSNSMNFKRMPARPGPPGRTDIGPKGLEFDPGRWFLPNESPRQNHSTRARPARPKGAAEQPWHTICSTLRLPKRSCRRDECGPFLV